MKKYVYDDVKFQPEDNILPHTQKLYDNIMSMPFKGHGMKIVIISENMVEVGEIIRYQLETKCHILLIDDNLQRLNLLNWDIRELSEDDLLQKYQRKKDHAERGTVKIYDNLMSEPNKGVDKVIIISSELQGIETQEVGTILYYDKINKMHLIEISNKIQRLNLLNWKVRDMSQVKRTLKNLLSFFHFWMKDLFDFEENNFVWLKNSSKIKKNKDIILNKLQTVALIHKYREDLGISNLVNSSVEIDIYILMSILELLDEDYIIFSDEELQGIIDSQKEKSVTESDFMSKINYSGKLLDKKRCTREEKIGFLQENDISFNEYFEKIPNSISTVNEKDFIDKKGFVKRDYTRNKLEKAIKIENKEHGNFISLDGDRYWKLWMPIKKRRFE